MKASDDSVTPFPAEWLTAPELLARVRQAAANAVLVPPRILRRVIKRHRGLGGLGLRVPHRKGYLLPRDALLGIVTAAELGMADQPLPEEVLLLPLPEAADLRRPAVTLRGYWRLIFHAAVHRAYDGLRRQGRFDRAQALVRIDRVGAVVFEEARAVLRQEHYLLDADDPAAVWEEFAALYLELRHFDPHRLGQFFPAARPADCLDAVLAEDVDAHALVEQTRPAGAAEEVPRPAEEPVAPESADDTHTGPGGLRLRAETAARQGNQVRAAVLRLRAAAKAPPTQAGGLLGAARGDMEILAGRLQQALALSADERQRWAECLVALLPAAALRTWNVEQRLLYDLQKVCVDAEKPLFAVDLVEWVVSWGRRPIKRPLPDQPLVLAVKHLRSAAARAPRARLADKLRHRLSELIQHAVHTTEERQRRVLRPKCIAALDAVGLRPAGVAERLSRDKLVEELLDRAGERGFLSIGDLRDAVARNRLKLPDLSGPIEFVLGDPLIRANRQLAVAADGIYRRGEIYLRWLQRLSSLFFGNPIGRWLTLFLLLPFVGSLMILKGLDEITEKLHHYAGTPEFHTFNAYSFVGVALFLLPLIHLPRFRAWLWAGLVYLGKAIRLVVYDLPVAALRLPLVRAILQSRPYLLFFQFVGKPVLWSVPLAALLWLLRLPTGWVLGGSAAWAVLVSVLINTRAGMVVEETATDAVARTWQLVSEDLLPGLFRFVVWVFRALLEYVERTLYTVDEWLRFRQGESRMAFVAKLVLGLFWFLLTYVVRFAITLLLEPQINPIKHFPVVTVSHKLLLPFAFSARPESVASPFGSLLVVRFGLPVAEANFWAFWIIFAIPGIFGFLAWELKENWRLYRANQSATLDPVMIGSHGEQVIHLLRPGLHSGTLPKLYAGLRRSRGAAEHKREEGLHHVEEEVRRFVERDLVAVLAASARWGATGEVHVGAVVLATNAIRFELVCAALSGDALRVEWSNRGGWLAVQLQPGWSADLPAAPRQALHDALAGFYKMAGVDLVWEDVRAKLPAGAAFDVGPEGLTVWTDAARTRGVRFDLRHPEQSPRGLGGAPAKGPAAAELLFSATPLTWSAWAEQWERDQRADVERPLLPGVRLL